MPANPLHPQRAGPAWQPDVLLRTKLYIPQVRSNHVARPALLDRLTRGAASRLTLLSAPVGFGKTTLLSDWIAHARLPVAWVSLDARDNHPRRFAAYVLAALSTLELGLGPDLSETLLDPPASVNLEAVFTRLINDAAEAADDFVLVLDDYHLISTEAIHAALSFLVERLPAQMHLFIASRADPPLPLAQLRARGELVELRAADLRFSADEARVFLSQTMQLEVNEAEARALQKRTEGWVASLQLAALARHSAPAAEAGPVPFQAGAGPHPYLVDYLAEQVLLQQPPAVQRFLLETSILERLSPALCDWTLEIGDWRFELERDAAASQSLFANPHSFDLPAQLMLDYLERSNLFLSPLDGLRQWYRYHPLFAEFLQARLQQTRPERWAELHGRAALWCERHHMMEEAVGHALAARDYDLATRLIEQVAETLWARSQILTMWRWLHAIPAELVRAQPRLGIQMAWAYAISGQLDEVEPYLLAVEAQVGGLPPGDPPSTEEAWHATPQRLAAQVSILRGFVARFQGEAASALAHAQQALSLIPAHAIRARGVAALVAGHACLLLGQTAASDRWLSEALAAARAARHAAAGLSAINYLALLRSMQGRLREVAALYREAVRWVDETGAASYSGVERIGLGATLREQNQLAEAAELIAAGLDRAEAGGDFTFLRDGYVAQARLAQARGDWANARRCIARAEQVARRSLSNRDIPLMAALRARLSVAEGDLPAALDWAAASGLSADDPPGFLQEYAHLTLARVLLLAGRLPEADRLLRRLLAAAEVAGRHGRVIEILAVQALVLQARGDRTAAQAALARALRLADPEGYVRVFADEGLPMAVLLAGVRGEYALVLRAAILLAAGDGQADDLSLPVDQPAPGSAQPLAPLDSPSSVVRHLSSETDAPPVLLSPLSDRERVVLRLMAAGLSNQDIAAELVVAPSTVHWHLKNIYSKLNVHSRTQAAAVARELGLLTPP
jgi:LuxR family maltose regulon positive regulatory protein